MNNFTTVPLEIFGPDCGDVRLGIGLGVHGGIGRGLVSLVLSGFQPPWNHPVYLDLSQRDQNHYPYTVEDEGKELTHAWISRRSHLIVAHGLPPGERPKGYGQYLPQRMDGRESALHIDNPEGLQGVLVTSGSKPREDLIEQLADTSSVSACFTRQRHKWEMNGEYTGREGLRSSRDVTVTLVY